MREFYLMNNYGQIYKFDYSTGTLVSGIDNIGIEKEVEYTEFDSNYKKLYEKNPTQDISLTLTFINGYKGYKAFLDFIESADFFYFYYKAVEWKYCYAEIESLSKTELSAGALISTLAIKKLSYWFKDVTKEIEIETDGGGKYYSYSYPFKYSNSISGMVTISNNGYAKAPLRILLNGAFSNPEIIITKDGEEVSRLKIYYESKNAILEVNSFSLDQKIEITENGETINAYEYQDFSADNFLMLGKGSYTLEFKPNVATPPKCVITMMEGYLGN